MSGRRPLARPTTSEGGSTRRAFIVVNVLPRWVSDFNAVSDRLAEAGFAVTIFTSAPDPTATTGWRSARGIEAARQELDPDIEVRFLPYSTLRVGALALVRTIVMALRLAIGNRDALFILWTGIPTLTWGPVLRLLNRRVLYMITGLSPVRSPNRQSRMRRFLVTAIDRRLFTTDRCRILVHNRDDKKFLDDSYELPDDRVVVTPGCGVVPSAFPFTDPPDRPHRPAILVPVRLLVDKGVLDAAEASRRLAAIGIDHEMWFTSNLDPTHPTALTAADVERISSTTPTVRFLGFQDSLVERYEACDVVCVPTYFPEGLPTALLEAASSGRPIVTCDNVGGRDFIRDGVDGFVVPPRSPDALAHALAVLLTDPVLADRLRKSAYERFLAGYTKRHMLDITVETIERLGVEVDVAPAQPSGVALRESATSNFAPTAAGEP